MSEPTLPSSSDSDSKRGGSRLPLLFVVVFFDLVGFGIVLPLLPFYAERFGGSGVEVGLLVMVYSAIQLFMAPFWGRLSDRVGRRPILIIGLVGSAISYLVFAYANSLTMLFASRILAGLGGSTVPVAEAYIADVTPPEKRAGNIGLIGAAFGLGFIVGPALGGISSTWSLEAPGLIASALCAINGLIALAFLRESRPAKTASQPTRHSPLEYVVRLARDPRSLNVLAVYFFFSAAWAVLQPTFSLFGAARFELDERSVGYLFAYLGIISAIMQGALVRRIVPRIGEARLIRLSGVPFVTGLLIIGYSMSFPTLLAGLALLAIGYGGVVPAALGLLSRHVSDDVQGGTLGVGQSVGSLARVAGPFVAGVAFDAMGIAWPYFIGAAVAAAAALLAVGLVQPTPAVARGDAT